MEVGLKEKYDVRAYTQIDQGGKLAVKLEKKERYNVTAFPGGTDDFSLKNILFDKSRCGGRKCFFHLKKGPNSVFDTGYIVDQTKGKFDTFNKFQRTWDLAIDLEKDYNVSTLIIAPQPQVLPINETFIENLIEGVPTRKYAKKMPLSPSIALIAQKVKVAPKSSIVWQTVYDRYRVPDYPWIVTYLTEFVQRNVKRRNMFCHNIFSNLNTTKRILADPKYRCLCMDFQVMMDHEGIFHYIDLDRCFEDKKTPKVYREANQFLDDLALAFRRTFQAMNETCSFMS